MVFKLIPDILSTYNKSDALTTDRLSTNNKYDALTTDKTIHQ